MAPYHLVLALADDTEVKQLLESQNLEVRSFIEALKDRKPKITVQHDDSFPYLAKYVLPVCKCWPSNGPRLDLPQI